jgi:hypothetical protein
MESIPDRAAAVLARHPSPAVSLLELAAILKDDTPGVPIESGVILDSLKRCPSRFRVVRGGSGLRSLAGTLGVTGSSSVVGREWSGDPESPHPTLARSGPWILGLDPPRPGGSPPAMEILRATLGFLGQRLDEDSGRSVARWMGFLEECTRIGERARSPRSPQLG